MNKKELYDTGYTFFELNENDKQILKSSRDTYLTLYNINSFSYIFKASPSIIREQGIENLKITLEVNRQDYRHSEDNHSKINDIYQTYSSKIANIIDTSTYQLIDGRCEMMNRWFNRDLDPVLENIYNRYYSADKKFSFTIRGRLMMHEMLLTEHTDGAAEIRPCTILIYTNEDWKPGDGGELVVNDEVLEPILGNAAILDFTHGKDVKHGVNKILNKDFVRKSFTVFVQ